MDFFDLGSAASAEAHDTSILERNLAAIAQRCPATAERIRSTAPAPGLTFVETDDGVPAVALPAQDAGASAAAASADDPLGLGGIFDEPAHTTPAKPGRFLASKRRPLDEARRFAETIDPQETAAVCILGFGAGYHGRAFKDRLGPASVILCFEPDVALLRAVLERVDHSDWLAGGNVIVLTDPDDAPAISQALTGLEPVLAIGVKIVDHPASTDRLGEAAGRFAARFTDVLRAVRTSVVTTLVHSQITLRNAVMNAGDYAAAPGVGELAGAAAGRVGVVVAAGPSLARNIAQLARPGVRDRVVIIAAQTVLKTLLRNGIRPHYVTALDYHELSGRFYEGLTKKDVEGVTLVVEPKANPAIFDSFPGKIRCVSDERLDKLLGPELSRGKAALPAGATVAHLSYYLARHLGCNPIVMIGQDLGFSDGQYYAAGAAIHDVWAGELNSFNSLEMLEWQRIAREKSLLRKMTDVNGRAIYTDEQMATYLAQFEVEFARDVAAGYAVIDATEGGVRKRHTMVMPLAEAFERYLPHDADVIDLPSHDRSRAPDGETRRALAARLADVAKDAATVARKSREAAATLNKMIDRQGNHDAVNRLIRKVYDIRDSVRLLEPAYGLVMFVNQAGTLNRFRADRAIDLAAKQDDELQRQKRQIERDIRNVEWIAEAADTVAAMLRRGHQVIEGKAEKLRSDADAEATPAARTASKTERRREQRLGALIMVHPTIGGLGTPRALKDPIAPGLNALQMTVKRLLRSGLPKIVLAGDREDITALLGEVGRDRRVVISDASASVMQDRARAVGASRIWAPACWRGAVGGLTCYDESLDPRLLAAAMQQCGLDAAVVVGADWCLVDPKLIDAVVERYTTAPEGTRIALTQAVPGLAGFVIDHETAENLAGSVETAGSIASIGGILGYVPVAPQSDPIAKGFCVPVSPAIRDAGVRFIPDARPRRRAIRKIVEHLGADWADATAGEIVRAWAEVVPDGVEVPQQITLELCGGRIGGGLWAQRLREAWDGHAEPDRPSMPVSMARTVIEAFAAAREDSALTLHGVGDPLLYPHLREVISTARAAGIGAIHLRTDLLRESTTAEDLLRLGVDVLSIDVLAVRPETYELLGGLDRYEHVKEQVEAINRGRRPLGASGLPMPYVVPRITRCDEVLDEIEPFYDGWLMVTGAAVIDPAPGTVDGARTAALPLPTAARKRLAQMWLTVRSDGTVPGISQSGPELWHTEIGSAGSVWGRIARIRRSGETPRLAAV